MRLCYYAPSRQNQPLLTMHAVVEDLGAPAVELVPAMLANLHIRLAGRSAYVFADGRRVEAPAISLIGPTSAAYRIEMSPDLRMVGVGLLPLGWLSLVRVPAQDIADDVIDGAGLWGRQAAATCCEQLAGAPLDGSHIGLVEALLARGGASRHAGFVAAVDHWLEQGQGFSVDALAASLEISRRQLQRLMLECYGAPPKVIAMKYRALSAAARMAAQDRPPIAQVLAHYADQPHLTRDFHRFIGMTPGHFIRGQVSVAAATMIGRRQAGASRPLVLWS